MVYDTVIIGGGVIGLSILRASLLAGYNAILLERNADLCDCASGRNSGVLCTGVDAPMGSLERALIRILLHACEIFVWIIMCPRESVGRWYVCGPGMMTTY